MGICTSKAHKRYQKPEIHETINISSKGAKLSLNKLGEIRSQDQTRSICYIPEKNLLVALRGEGTLYIYNTAKNFKLIARRNTKTGIDTISYSKELKKILAGGEYIQIWDLKTFNVEIQVDSEDKRDWFKRTNHKPVFYIQYLPSSDIIVAKEGDWLRVYDRNLKHLPEFWFPTEVDTETYFPRSPNRRELKPSKEQIFSISRDLLLGINHTISDHYFLANMKGKEVRIPLEGIFIPKTSCVVMTEEISQKKVFTCLTRSRYASEPCFKLTQFTINPERGDLNILRKGTNTNMTFSQLQRLENSKYLLAHNNLNETLLLLVEKNQVETIRIFSKPEDYFRKHYLSNCIMLKDESLVFIEGKNIKLFKFVREKDSEKIQRVLILYGS